MTTGKREPAAMKPRPAQSSSVYRPGEYKKEALAFLKERIGDTQFDQIMGRTDSRQHPYVAARLFLSPLDWDKYVWIEQHGTLEGFL